MKRDIVKVNQNDVSVINDIDVDKPKSFIEILEEESDKIGGKYLSILYPKFMLSAYDRVYSMRWPIDEGNPESFIDQHLSEWIRKLSYKDIYMNMLINCVKSDDILMKILCLRMNYALTIGKESVSGEVKIFRNKSGHLLFNESFKTVGDSVVYDGDLDSSFLSDEEIEEWANKFYSSSETVSSSKTGLPEHVLYKINEMLSQFGYDINTDLNSVYNELNNLNKMYIEEGIVARVAFLVIISSIGEQRYIK